jgi:DNA-binding CsgD family transcriptional regulator
MQAVHASVEELAHVGGWALDLVTRESVWTDELCRLHGLPTGATPSIADIVASVHVDDRGRIAALLTEVVERPDDVPAAGIAAEYRVSTPDGVREMRFLGRIERDGDGAPAYWLGSAQDVTEQRVTERELRVRYALSQALREWESFEEGVVVLLRRLGTALEFPLGALWAWDDDAQDLFCRAFWAAPDVDGAATEELARRQRFRAGEGAPGRAWSVRRPVAVRRLSATSWARRTDAAALGLESLIAVPALGGDGPVAVLSFYSFESVVPSPRIVEGLVDVAGELGRFLTRHRGRLEPRTLSGREVEVLQLAAEGSTGPEIAEQLRVSPSTVKTHFENLYEKLGVGDRTAAVARALRTGLIR